MCAARNGMCETTHSQPTGIGPQKSRLTNVITVRMPAASTVSRRRWRALPGVGGSA